MELFKRWRMDDAKSDENRRGGGVRLPALLLALTCTLGWTAAAPHEARAEGQQTYTLDIHGKLSLCTTDCDFTPAAYATFLGSGQWVIGGSNTTVRDTLIASYSALGYAYLSTPIGGWYGIDNDGRLWAGHDEDTSLPLQAHQMTTAIKFSSMGSKGNNSYNPTIYLTGTPYDWDKAAAVTQIPTAGAPVSDLTIPALAVGGGLAALGFGLARRRRA